MSSPHFEISVQFWSQPTLKRFSKGPEVPCEAWLQLLASAPCHLRSVAGSFWSYPSSGAPHTSGPSCASNSVVASSWKKEPQRLLFFPFCLTMLPCPPPQYFFSIAVVVGQAHKPGSSANIQSMGGNAYSSSSPRIQARAFARFRRGTI